MLDTYFFIRNPRYRSLQRLESKELKELTSIVSFYWFEKISH